MGYPRNDAEVRHPGLIVAILAGCGIVVALMQTLVIPLIPALPRLLRTSADNTSWVITVTLLAGAVTTPISGRLGGMFGKKKMLIVSLALLSAGSLFWIWPVFRDGNGPRQVVRSTRLRSRPKLARPYIWRLSILSRLTLPSTTPEFQERVRPLRTAS